MDVYAGKQVEISNNAVVSPYRTQKWVCQHHDVVPLGSRLGREQPRALAMRVVTHPFHAISQVMIQKRHVVVGGIPGIKETAWFRRSNGCQVEANDLWELFLTQKQANPKMFGRRNTCGPNWLWPPEYQL